MRTAVLVLLGGLCLAQPAWRLWQSLKTSDWSSAESVGSRWIGVGALWISVGAITLVSSVISRVASADLVAVAFGYLARIVVGIAAIVTVAMLVVTVLSRRSQISSPSANAWTRE
jgi:hypothetical protein